MSLIAKASGGTRVPPIDEGSYVAVCCGIVDLGEQENKKYGTTRPQVCIMWEIVGETVTIDGEKSLEQWQMFYTNSLHDRSGLRKDLKSWRGREFTEEELAGFNLANIIGVPCMLQVIHNVTDNGVYANIASIMSLPKGTPRPKLTLSPVVFDIDTSSEKELEELPEWIATKIKESESWKNRKLDKLAGKVEDLPDADDEDDLPF
jgi:hypothetical protein